MTAAHTAQGHPELEALAAFVDGTLPAAERQTVVDHLDTCGDCYGLVVATLRANEEAEAEAPGRGTVEFPLRRPSRWLWGALAASVALLTVAGWFGWRYLVIRQQPRALETMANVVRKAPADRLPSLWLPLGAFPERAQRGGAAEGGSLAMFERDNRSRIIFVGSRDALAGTPRVWRTRETSRALVALDLALEAPALAKRDLPADWEQDCILAMLAGLAETADPNARLTRLSTLTCTDPTDQAHVDLNRALLLWDLGRTDEARQVWLGLPEAAKKSPVAGRLANEPPG